LGDFSGLFWGIFGGELAVLSGDLNPAKVNFFVFFGTFLGDFSGLFWGIFRDFFGGFLDNCSGIFGFLVILGLLGHSYGD
jgi:hypothetical protein